MERHLFSKKEKFFTLFLLILTVVMLLATVVSLLIFRKQIESAGILDEEGEKTYSRHYALIVENPSDSLWDAFYEAAENSGDALDVYVEMFGQNLSTAYTKEDLLSIAIESKVDGIIVEADESDEMTSLIYRAKKEGIPVVTVLHDCVGSGRVSFIGMNNYSLGSEYGNLIIQASDEIRSSRQKQQTGNGATGTVAPIHVLVLMDGQSQDNSQSIIYSTIQESLDGAGITSDDIIIETERISTTSVFRTEEKVRDIVVGSEELPDIIVCLNEQNTTSVYQTLVDQNKVGQIYVIGYYDSDTILKAIEKSGIYATVTIDTDQMGVSCVNALNEYDQTGYVSDFYSIDFTRINSGNVKEYLRRRTENATR